MKYNILLLIGIFLLSSCHQNSENAASSSEHKSTKHSVEKVEYAMVIHGGAGTILKKNMTEEMEQSYVATLNEALDTGASVLSKGGSALDAVTEVIKLMEDSPLFNAGKGSVFTNAGTNEMDASIMMGIDQNAGAIGGVTNVKNPITAARKVLENSEHVLLTGQGAELFAEQQGCEMVDPSYFSTERRLKSLERAKAKENMGFHEETEESKDFKYGTVGCVALDKAGNIVAGTSTGGMTNKRYNRVGDSPIIGAGTYADNATCGISSTGHGEYFIRYAVAYDIAARMEYKGISIEEAAKEVVMEKLVKKGGSGGVVGLDSNGNITMTFNTPGMYRGYIKPGERQVKIYKE